MVCVLVFSKLGRVGSGGIPLDFCVWVFSESMCSGYVSVQVYVLVCVGRE
jgi:hypothetical protein